MVLRRVAVLLVVLTGGCAAIASAAGAAGDPALLAYVKPAGGLGAVWVAGVDGSSPTRLGPGEQPLVAPSGAMVAASEFGQKGAALTIYTVGSTTSSSFFAIDQANATPLAWSPDSRYLAVSLVSQLPKSNAPTALWVIDTQTGATARIAQGYTCGASFAPSLPDRLVYGLGAASSFCLKRSNIFTALPDGTDVGQLTHDGQSLNPVWGTAGIAFDHERIRGHNAPAYQVWTMGADGSHRTQITHVKVSLLVEGLVPLGFSSGGGRLLAAYEGQDTSETWTIDFRRHRNRQLMIGGRALIAGALARNGRSVLVTAGGINEPAGHNTVERIPFSGGQPTVLVTHAGEPSWNR
jgi:hypothetical protein